MKGKKRREDKTQGREECRGSERLKMGKNEIKKYAKMENNWKGMEEKREVKEVDFQKRKREIKGDKTHGRVECRARKGYDRKFKGIKKTI